MYHTGWVESKHDPENTDWYEKYDTQTNCMDWIRKLRNGDYIPCGSSGGQLHMGIYVCGGKYLNSARACCFVFGRDCGDSQIRRKWSCCGEGGQKTMKEMYEIPGCESFTRGKFLAEPKDD